jgi:asparagine synthase (glutamine-hydrolysing)
MSALFGIWNFQGRPVEENYLREAAALLAPRGPDGQTIYAKDNLGIVYSGFHTTRESRREVQPHVTRSGVVIGWDGRLDNRDELTIDLARLASNDDADVTVAALTFERWGARAFAKLVGDWAISIWDPKTRTLFLATDYIGIRHLYYLVQDKRVLWSTCLTTLVRLSGCSLTVNDEYVAGYLANSPAANLTPYGEIQAIAPGEFITIRNGTVRSYRYWSFQPKHKIRYKTDTEYEEQFRHLFRQAVRRRLRSDSPILGQLSGGIDSSSIICMADDVISKGEADTIRLDTISTFDPKEPGGDERVYFAKIEEYRGRAGHHLNREEYGHTFELNFSNFITAPGSSEYSGKLRDDLLGLFHGHGYRVLLSGIGGDELLGGVPNPLSQLADLIVKPRPIRLVRQLTAWSLIKKRPCIHLLGQTLGTFLPPSMRAMMSPQGKVAPWIQPAFSRSHRLSVRQLGPVGGYGFWLPSRRESAQTVATLARQMARLAPHGIASEERRYPFLDQSLVEFLLAIPATQLLRPGQRRSLMRRALTSIVPAEILWRKTKAFVNRGVLVAFENSWPGLEALFESPLSDTMGYINPSCFLDKLRSAKNGDATHMMHLLTTVSLELWLRSGTHHGVLRAGSRSHSATQQPVLQLGA